MSDFFPGFEQRRVETSGATVNLVTGGSGQPLLLLHGYPQTHVMWRKVAPLLAQGFTIVVPDLRGTGDSPRPPAGADFTAYSKRALALDQVETMAALGFDKFAVAGHDRRAGCCSTIPTRSPARHRSTSYRRSIVSKPSTKKRRPAAGTGSS